jgi:mannose-6-phosphate isomerase
MWGPQSLKRNGEKGDFMNLYPLRLEPQVKEIVWGGRWLAEELGRPAPGPEARLGESWEAYSGSLVTNGPLAGRNLADLFNENATRYFGEKSRSYPRFPLLVKFIDARENLSVQVHPDNALAQQIENYPYGKTEFWYVMKAQPGAEICYGLNETAQNLDQLEKAMSDLDLLRYLQKAPVKEGDVVYLPAGTVHALTKGIVVYELQQDTDITYRLYDWGRVGRQIHIEKGLKAIKLDHPNPQVTHPALAPKDGYAAARLVESEFFTADLYSVNDRAELQAKPDSFTLLSVLEGRGTLEPTTTLFEDEPLARGQTLLIPPGLDFRLTSSGRAQPLKVIGGTIR